MLKSLIIASVTVLATACAPLNYTIENYGSVQHVEHSTRHDTFVIFDKPAEGRMMVTSSVGAAFAGGLVKGLTMQPIAIKPVFQEAAESFLASTGRQCRIVDGYLLMDPQWEFKYECGGAVGPTAAIKR